jgi:ATP-dependent Clp protease ATP-binding subunit ClpA
MFERFTPSARGVVIDAQRQARALHHNYIGTEHLLLALLDPGSGAPAAILRDAGVQPEQVVAEIERLVPRRPRPLDVADAEALRTIGIDLDAVVATIEATFGPRALQPPPPAPVVSRWRRVRRRMRRLRRRFRVSRPCRQRPERGRAVGGHLPFVPRSKKVLELSLRESLRLGHKEIGSEHILLGLLREGEGLAAQILVGAGLTLDDLRKRTLRALDDAA